MNTLDWNSRRPYQLPTTDCARQRREKKQRVNAHRSDATEFIDAVRGVLGLGPLTETTMEMQFARQGARQKPLRP